MILVHVSSFRIFFRQAGEIMPSKSTHHTRALTFIELFENLSITILTPKVIYLVKYFTRGWFCNKLHYLMQVQFRYFLCLSLCRLRALQSGVFPLAHATRTGQNHATSRAQNPFFKTSTHKLKEKENRRTENWPPKLTLVTRDDLDHPFHAVERRLNATGVVWQPAPLLPPRGQSVEKRDRVPLPG